MIVLLLVCVHTILHYAVTVQFRLPLWPFTEHLQSLLMRSLVSFPKYTVLVLFTHPFHERVWMQSIMFVASLILGSYTLHQLNVNSMSLNVMLTVPGTASLWCYCLVDLQVLPSALSCILLLSYKLVIG